MPFSQLIPSFNAGELSPYLDARSDIEKYTSGCKELRNMIIMPYGGVYRRPGTEYVAAAKFGDLRCRLIGFNFSTTTRYVLELGEEYIRFYYGGTEADVAQIESSPGVPFEVATPYQEADLREVQYIQINDVMYLVHPSYPPQKLSRISDDDWTLIEVDWDFPALLDENFTLITIAASAVTGAGITLTATAPAWVTGTFYREGDGVLSGGVIYKANSDFISGANFAADQALNRWTDFQVFTTDNVGGYFQISHARANNGVEKPITSNGSSSNLVVLGDWGVTTGGTWTATVYVERSYDNGSNWDIIRTLDSNNDKNYSETGFESVQCLLRLRVAGWVSGVSPARARLTAADARIYGIVKITGYTSDLIVTGDVISGLAATTATKFWSEGAWSTRRGFPRTVALHEQRVYYAGTDYRAQSIWGSQIDDFQNFRVGTDDSAGLFFSLSSQESNPINWMTSQDELLIGTAGDEWTLGSTSIDTPITPTSVRAARQSSYGSKYLRALVVNDVILFVQRQGRKVRELVYQFEKDGWVAPDLTVLAEHVTKGELLEVAFAQQPDAIYWTIAGNGELVGMTYERDQNVVGWHRHTTQGTFESVATIYGANGPDEVWVAVQREVDGATVRYIERFRPDYRDAFDEENKSSWWYLDCAKRVTLSPAGTVVTGLDHLEALNVDTLVDGCVGPTVEVIGGEITLPAAKSIVLAGLPYTSLLTPMKLDMMLQSGSTRGSRKKISRLDVALFKSLGGERKGNSTNKWDPIQTQLVGDVVMDTNGPAFTGDVDFPVGGNYTRGCTISLRQTQPLPLCVLAINPQWEATS